MARTRIEFVYCRHIDLHKIPDSARVFDLLTEGGQVTLVFCQACAEAAGRGEGLTGVRFHFNQLPPTVETIDKLKQEFWTSIARVAWGKEFARKKGKGDGV